MSRVLTVKHVQKSSPGSKRILVDFNESIITFNIKESWLLDRGIPSLSPGQKVSIVGAKGDRDVDLWCEDCIVDMTLI